MYVLSVNGAECARFNSESLLLDSSDANLTVARKIINHLIELSPVEIKLGSFS